MMVPPQKYPSKNSPTCQGNSWGVASTPPTILLGWALGIPHASVLKMNL